MLEPFSLEFEEPWPGMFSCLHSVRIGSSTMNKTTHCSAMSPSTLIASSQEAEGSLIPYLILQPFRHRVGVFGITNNLFYGLLQSSGGRRVGTTGRRNVLSIREQNRRFGSRRRNWERSRMSGMLQKFRSFDPISLIFLNFVRNIMENSVLFSLFFLI